MSDLLGVGFKIKHAFFDRAAVTNQLYPGQVEALSKIGAYVRRTARSSIRPPRQMRLSELRPERRRIFERAIERNQRLGLSLPTLPFAPSRPGEPPRSPTGLYRDTILFAYDQGTHSTVVGPVALNGRQGRDVPHTLEEGGRTEYRGNTIFIAARPHMRPALAKETSKLPQLFEGIM
jgi:hypothetical protein